MANIRIENLTGKFIRVSHKYGSGAVEELQHQAFLAPLEQAVVDTSQPLLIRQRENIFQE